MAASPDAVSDAELLESARRGDEQAFLCLVRRHEATLLRLAGRFLPGREDAEDAVQEAIVAAYRQLGRFRGEASFSTWIGRITVYTAVRMARRCPGMEECRDDCPQRPGEADRATTLAVRDAVARLPEKQRIAVVLRFYEELNGREIAELTGWRESTVWTRLYSALARLRSELEEGEDL